MVVTDTDNAKIKPLHTQNVTDLVDSLAKQSSPDRDGSLQITYDEAHLLKK